MGADAPDGFAFFVVVQIGNEEGIGTARFALWGSDRASNTAWKSLILRGGLMHVLSRRFAEEVNNKEDPYGCDNRNRSRYHQ